MECGAMRFYSTVLIACLAAGCGASSETNSTQGSASQTSAGDTATALAQVGQTPAPTGQPKFEAQPAADTGAAESADPQAGAAHLAGAEELHRRGDTVGALRKITQAIAADPTNSEYYAKRAALLAHVDLLPKAISDISRAIELDGDDPRLRNMRGYYYLTQQNYERATQDFNDAIGLDLAYSHPYNNRGLTRLALGEYEFAVADFDAALRIDPDYRDALNNRGLALMQLKRYDEAVQSFTTAIAQNEEYPGGWFNRALAYQMQEQFAEAVEDLTKAIELQPNQP
jgi:tetratricopeptide (TPR) repeat protein